MSVFGYIAKKNLGRVLASSAYGFGQGLKFDKTQTFANAPAGLEGQAIPRQFTKIFWFRFDTDWNTSNTASFITSGLSGTQLIFRAVKVSSTLYNIRLFSSSGTGGVTLTSNNVTFDYKIHQVAITCEETTTNVFTIKMFLDGVRIESGLATLANADRTYTWVNIYIGSSNVINTSFNGVFGEARLIPSVLTETQIFQNWNKGNGADILNTAHTFLYKFSGDGNDSSGNARHLTVVNNPSYVNFV